MDDLKNTSKRFLRNRYSRSDYYKILSGFKNGERDVDFISELENQWEETNSEEVNDFNSEYNWHEVNKKLQRQKTSAKEFKLIRLIRNAAAVLFIPLLIASALYYFTNNNQTTSSAWAEIKCPAGVKTEFELPDGSTGVLNSESVLRYKMDFKNERAVELNGEAYFDVQKDKSHKFTVATSQIKVEVLGTSFNVMAYNDDLNQEVTLKTGKVKIVDVNNNDITNLIPDQQFVFNTENNKYSTKEVNAQSYTAWVTGKLIIQNERFEDIAKRLSRWYNVEIEVIGKQLKDYQYYATFENEPLNEVLRLISITAPIEYKIEDRMKTKEGNFTKQKITFKPDEKRLNYFN